MLRLLDTALPMVAVLSAGGWWVVAVRRFPAIGVIVGLAATVLESAGTKLPSITAGSIEFHAGDLIALLLGVGVLASLAGRVSLRRYVPWCLTLLLLVLALSLLLGIRRYGLTSAMNAARSFSGFAAATVYVAIVPRRDLRSAWVSSGQVLALIGAAYMLLGGVGSAATGGRALPAVAALVIAQASVLDVTGPRHVSSVRRALPWAMLVVVVLLQHRSVWVATIAMFGFAAVRTIDSEKLRVHLRRNVAAFFAIGVLSALVTPADSALLSRLESSVNEASDREDSTWIWRTTSWRELRPSTLTEWVLGQPFGHGFTRSINGNITETGPHNYFVTALITTGLIGSMAFIIVYLVALRRARTHLGLAAAIFGTLVYYVAYDGSLVTGLLLGWGLAVPRMLTAPGSSDSMGAFTERAELP